MPFARLWSRAPTGPGEARWRKRREHCRTIPRTASPSQTLRRSWTRSVQRGEVFRLRAPRDARGHELTGARYGVIVQADELLALSTVVVAPTSTSVRGASFRPEVVVAGRTTRVVVEQVRAVDQNRLGESQGLLNRSEMDAVDRALGIVLGL